MYLRKFFISALVIFVFIGIGVFVWAQQQTGLQQVTLDRIYFKLEEISNQLRQSGYDQVNQKLDQIIQTQANMMEDLTKIKMRQRY